MKIMTTYLAGGLHKGYRPASKGAGFHSVQARPLTRRHPLKVSSYSLTLNLSIAISCFSCS